MFQLPGDADFGELNLKIITFSVFNTKFCTFAGVCHADKLMLMFTSNLIPPMNDPNDIKVSKMLLNLWTSFAANGFSF